MSNNSFKIGFSDNEKLGPNNLSTLQAWKQKIDKDLPSFGEAGRDLLDGISNKYLKLMKRTNMIREKVYDHDDQSLEIEEIVRPWNDVTDRKTMDAYNEQYEKYNSMKGKIWTYLSQSITTDFYNELSMESIKQLRAENYNVKGLLALIKQHALKGSDPLGIQAL
jgi:hypothetical protein